jgi:hypothetical protein
LPLCSCLQASLDAGLHWETHAAEQFPVGLFRELIRNPFRSGPLDSGKLRLNAASLARSAYVERILPFYHLDNARLAVRSDALEAEGGGDAELLSHLRSPGPQVRGCWALDLILGKQ